MYLIQLNEGLVVKLIQSALGPKFNILLPVLENISIQTAKQKQVDKSNITRMSLITKTVRQNPLLVKIESRVS
jgi:hypothetical protein